MYSNLQPLSERWFRGNPDLETLRLDQLTPPQRASLAHATAGHEFYGVLHSRRLDRAVSAIDQDTAILFHTLGQPGPLSARLHRTLGADRDRIIARLVYDGILEIRARDGRFVHGLPATAELFTTPPVAVASLDHRLNEISRQAVSYAAELTYLGEPALADRLYHYHACPRTTAWEKTLPTRAAVSRWLGLSTRSVWRTALRAEYGPPRPQIRRDPWLRWHHRSDAGRLDLNCKIYVSPDPADLPAAFQRVAAVCCALAVPAFKVGAELPGVLRPDKLVLYFADTDALRRVARELELALRGLRAHGVPFTAPIDAAGMLSWGQDPPDDATAGFRGACSWRTFIANRLATALCRAPGQETNKLADFALQRIRLEGIEPDGWQPVANW